MRKVYKLEDLDCANCAAKMERAIAKIDGVDGGQVNFYLGHISIEAEESRIVEIMDQVVKVCRKVEPDCTIVR